MAERLTEREGWGVWVGGVPVSLWPAERPRGCGRSLTTVGWRLAGMSLAFAVSVWRVAASQVPRHHSEIPGALGQTMGEEEKCE